MDKLNKAILDLHGAQNRITNMINGDLNGLQHFNTVDLATMAEVSKSIASSLDYLDHLQSTLDSVRNEFAD